MGELDKVSADIIIKAMAELLIKAQTPWDRTSNRKSSEPLGAFVVDVTSERDTMNTWEPFRSPTASVRLQILNRNRKPLFDDGPRTCNAVTRLGHS